MVSMIRLKINAWPSGNSYRAPTNAADDKVSINLSGRTSQRVSIWNTIWYLLIYISHEAMQTKPKTLLFILLENFCVFFFFLLIIQPTAYHTAKRETKRIETKISKIIRKIREKVVNALERNENRTNDILIIAKQTSLFTWYNKE